MKKDVIALMVLVVMVQACSNNSQGDLVAQWKAEIIDTENAFSLMSVEEGIPEAFLAFAAKDAVLKRSNSLIIGWEAIKLNFENQTQGNVKLTWTPEFVDVAASGDLGYTYGYYTLASTDAVGNVVEKIGVFHTVWKKQENGDWRFVWD